MLLNRIRPQDVLEHIATMYGLIPEDLKGCCRDPYIVEARWLAIYCLKIFNYNFSEISRIMKCHHTSVMYAYKKLINELDNESIDQLSHIIHELNTLSSNDPLDLSMKNKEF